MPLKHKYPYNVLLSLSVTFYHVNLLTELCKSSWLVGMGTESHIPVGLVPSLWSPVWVPWLLLLCFSWQSRSPGFTQMLNFGSQLHGEKLQTQRFCYKKQDSRISASVLGSQKQAWGSAASRIPWSIWRLKKSYFTLEQTRKRNREIRVLGYFQNCFLR